MLLNFSVEQAFLALANVDRLTGSLGSPRLRFRAEYGSLGIAQLAVPLLEDVLFICLQRLLLIFQVFLVQLVDLWLGCFHLPHIVILNI